MTESLLMDSSFVVPLFSPGDDPIACLNKAIAFLTSVASSRYKSNATSSGGKQYKRTSKAWYKEKAMLAEAQESRKILDEEQLAFLTDPRVPDVLMENISNYGSDVISKVPHSKTYLNDVVNQGVQAMQDFEQPSAEKANKEQNNESVTAELERYKEQVKTFEQRLYINLSSREKMIDSQMDDMIKEKLALKEQVDSLEQNLSKQIKEKECLLQTFTIFKSESKEKEDKYMKNKIDLEKKIKELDNILFKVGQSAQTVHMLTKPQAFDDNIHKQALVASLFKIEEPKELPKVSLVNESLKKLKFHLARFDNVVKIRTTPDARTEEFFENNDLKAQLQDKDSTICKLKDIIKSLRENSKEENVNYDYCEIETKIVVLENSVAKLHSENEHLCNEINHVKQ
ncbi:hypothetical protein Tco_1061712, partial [Tanacetum coccineum]